MNTREGKSTCASTLTTANSERGQLSSLGLALTIGLLTLTLIHYSAVIKEIKKVEERAKTYLCLRHFVEHTRSQLKAQRRFDLAIQAVNAAIALALVSGTGTGSIPPLKTNKKLLIASSHLSYSHFLLKLLPSKWCARANKRLLFNTPWKARTGVLQRTRTGLSRPKQGWRFLIIGKNFGLSGKRREGGKGGMLWSIREVGGDLFW